MKVKSVKNALLATKQHVQNMKKKKHKKNEKERNMSHVIQFTSPRQTKKRSVVVISNKQISCVAQKK